MNSMMKRPAKEVGQGEANQGNERQEGIAEGMPVDNDAIAQSLGVGGADVILPDHLEHRGPDVESQLAMLAVRA